MLKNEGSYLIPPELVTTTLSIVKMILGKRLVSDNPNSIEIVRVGRPPVFPCRKSQRPDKLDISQLEWAAEKGEFWFFGPIKSLNVLLDRGIVQGTLVSELDRISFITTLNELNYEDFIEVKSNLVKTANDLGFSVEFEQSHCSHNVKVTISAEKPMSTQNVKDFLKGMEKVLKTV